MEITEGELARLISMGYTNGEILDQEFIEIFHKNKNNLKKNLKRILDKFLKQQTGNKSDDEESDESEKIGEILSSRKRKIKKKK
ncbi:unnamed protein product [Rhizophagus irregularis]|nr:unnamed protein product [Rhizophagus irregularis]